MKNPALFLYLGLAGFSISEKIFMGFLYIMANEQKF